MGLSGVLLYAQPSVVQELKGDAFFSTFVEDGRLLVVIWDMFRLRKPGEARRAASMAHSTGISREGDELGPGKVGG